MGVQVFVIKPLLFISYCGTVCLFFSHRLIEGFELFSAI